MEFIEGDEEDEDAGFVVAAEDDNRIALEGTTVEEADEDKNGMACIGVEEGIDEEEEEEEEEGEEEEDTLDGNIDPAIRFAVSDELMAVVRF